MPFHDSRTVIVSHSGKQYVHRLIQALLKNGYTVIFCTPLWWQKLPGWLKLLPATVRKKLSGEIRKRFFSFSEHIQIVQRRSIAFGKEFREKVLRANGEAQQLRLEKDHDAFAAGMLAERPSPVVIGYEISSVETFRRAKKTNAIAILDLAQIHYAAIGEIAHAFKDMQYVLRNKDIAEINNRKQTEYDLADFIITLSSFARGSLLDNGIPPGKVYEVHLGFDVQLFTPREAYNAAGPLRIMICGTDMIRKGLGLLIEAVRDMQRNGYLLELWITGPFAEIDAVIREYGRTASMHISGFLTQEELVKQYQEADIFVFPSYLDSWAMVVLEAMACGTPVIITENTGAKDAVGQGGGFIIPPGDKAALIEAVKKFYDDRSLLRSMGTKARETAEKYTWENYYKEIGAVMDDIISKGSQQN